MRFGLGVGKADGMAGDLPIKARTGQAGQPFLPQGGIGIRRREGSKAALAATYERGGQLVGYIFLGERGACHLAYYTLRGQMRERGARGAPGAAQPAHACLCEQSVIHHAGLHQLRGNGGGLLCGCGSGGCDRLGILALLRRGTSPSADAVAQHAAQPRFRGSEPGEVGQGGLAQGSFGDFAHKAVCPKDGLITTGRGASPPPDLTFALTTGLWFLGQHPPDLLARGLVITAISGPQSRRMCHTAPAPQSRCKSQS